MSKLTPIQFYLSQTLIIDQISQSLIRMKTQLKAFLFQNEVKSIVANKAQTEINKTHKREYSQLAKQSEENTRDYKRYTSTPKQLKSEQSQTISYSTPKNKSLQRQTKHNEQNSTLQTPKQFMNYIMDKVVYQNQSKQQQKQLRQTPQTLTKQYNENNLEYLLYSTKQKVYEKFEKKQDHKQSKNIKQQNQKAVVKAFPSIQFIESMNQLHEEMEYSKQTEDQKCLDLLDSSAHRKSLEQSLGVPFFGVTRKTSLQLQNSRKKSITSSKNQPKPIFIYQQIKVNEQQNKSAPQRQNQSTSHLKVSNKSNNVKGNISPPLQIKDNRSKSQKPIIINKNQQKSQQQVSKTIKKNDNQLVLDYSLYALTFSKQSDRLMNPGQDEKSIQFCFVDDENKIKMNKRMNQVQNSKCNAYDQQNLLNSYQGSIGKMFKVGNSEQQTIPENQPNHHNTTQQKKQVGTLTLSTPPKIKNYPFTQISPHFKNQTPKEKYLFCKKKQQAPVASVEKSIEKQSSDKLNPILAQGRIKIIEQQQIKQQQRPKSVDKDRFYTPQKCIQIARNPLKEMLFEVITLYPSEIQIFSTKYGKLQIKYKQIKQIINSYPDRRYNLVEIQQLGEKYLYFKNLESKTQFGKLCKAPQS